MKSKPQIRKTLTSAEVAEIFCVSRKTVTNWAQEGKIRAFKTPGGGSYGHWRFHESEIRGLLNGPVKP